MTVSKLIFAMAIVFVMVVGIGFAIVNLSSVTITDTYGSAPSSTVNDTTAMLTNVTAVGQSAGTGLLLVMACLLVMAVIALLIVYGRSK